MTNTRAVVSSESPLVTLFGIPRAFRGHVGMTQWNAVQSWARLGRCEVVLCGDDDGVAAIAAEVNARHLSHIARNEFGTPFLDSALAAVDAVARAPMLAYVNADIILTQDFIEAVDAIPFGAFLMAGQRTNVSVSEHLVGTPGWERVIRDLARQSGTLHPPHGSDYFVFPRGTFQSLPPFVVGRQGWDNWMFYDALRRRIPVVDCTNVVLAVHQNHDYSHVAGVQRGWPGPEGTRNHELAGGPEAMFGLMEATHELTAGGLRRRWTIRMLRGRLVSLKPWRAIRPMLRTVRRRLGSPL